MRTSIYISESNDPYFNLALEELLTESVGSAESGEAILYLWQNADTVVIGKSQNAWNECRTEALKEDGGTLARRTSGGGAVFHDLGNLCYSFITTRGKYDLQRQLKVILEAVNTFGIDAIFSGRNDIVTADGRKFSGNAFRFTKEAALMHGTLLVNADFSKLQNYLKVSPAKIAAKGISSVRSRVVNLASLSSSINIGSLKKELIDAFIKEYGAPENGPVTVEPVISRIEDGDIDLPYVTVSDRVPGRERFYDKYLKFSSWDWNYGQTLPFGVNIEKKFSWGLVRAGLNVSKGMITDVNIDTDAMDADLGETVSCGLKGVRLSQSDIYSALYASVAIIKNSGAMIGDPELIVNDIAGMLLEI